MNEIIFFIHVIIISLVTILAFKKSKEAIIATVALFCVLANLFVLKQINLFCFTPTASDAFSVGSIIGINLINEYFGTQESKKTINICMFCLLVYTIASQIHLAYVPSNFDTYSQHFDAILKFMPIITIASIICTFISLTLDRILYNFLKNKFNNKYFFARNLVSLFLVQAVDTILFTFLALSTTSKNLWDIIFIGYIVKIIAVLISLPIISIFRPKVQKQTRE